MKHSKSVFADLKKTDSTKIFKRSIKLLPALAARGAAPGDALAVAYNAAFLFYFMKRPFWLISPRQILRRYSLMEIAILCEDALRDGGEESGVDLNFEKAVKEWI